jgi:hypothetical protein
VRITPPPPPVYATSHTRSNHLPASSASSAIALLVGDYIPRSLPAYSQLFDSKSNGDRKIDCLVALPMYEPPEPSSSSAALETARLLAKSDEDIDDEGLSIPLANNDCSLRSPTGTVFTVSNVPLSNESYSNVSGDFNLFM